MINLQIPTIIEQMEKLLCQPLNQHHFNSSQCIQSTLSRVTMNMLNSVYNPYPESKNSQYINIYNKIKYTIIYCLMLTLIKIDKDDQR